MDQLDINGDASTTVSNLKGSDKFFFTAYADINIHENMIRDYSRTETYRQAIMQSSHLLKGKVVADVGCGTGILSCFCAKAGAKKVYGIDASAILEQAKLVVKENNLENIVQLVSGKAEDVELPEKVDVIVSEWMGNFLLFEAMLNSVVIARDRFLKEGGLILPSKCALFVAPVDSQKIYDRRIDFWSQTKADYDLSMECMIPFAKKRIFGSVRREDVPSSEVIGKPQELAQIDINTVTIKDLDYVKGSFKMACNKTTKMSGFTTWFDAYFEIQGKDTVVLSTSPFAKRTHWNQAVLYFDEPIPVKEGEVTSGSMLITPAVNNNRHLDIKLGYTIGDREPAERTYNTWKTPGPVEMY